MPSPTPTTSDDSVPPTNTSSENASLTNATATNATATNATATDAKSKDSDTNASAANSHATPVPDGIAPVAADSAAAAEAERAHYEQLKKSLRQSLTMKKQLQDDLDRLQQQIYDSETLYLNNSTSNTSTNGISHNYYGNIVKGFEHFTKSHGHGHHGSNANGNNANGVDLAFNDNDRIFSLSSASYVKQLENNK
ncbi:hypothetical protein TBLA_0I00860 [Henningerozyma blattae CBS 6284]|uniref:Chromatin modification-related protein EAF6 n=1 Tax=Henningerozyma blattae (strain ATCC 34711 / CBS 6284 / DSM 70876 / NBRC 10599 / NRRL Y-10934 / UCD 77-7) TaxID=1071380 RepID=I2H8P3_HENB6|nr:hypothetical protein TBLA_0I00860 [Tetrapisispora blattae CBS 6284]CCH62745.1 hypothetical protein TBLA_0I00860 [Tetrapisispora blattae CBS 6284]